MFGFGKNKKKANFPPVPSWKHNIDQPIESIAERVQNYADGPIDFAVFKHGTCAILPEGLSDEDAKEAALDALNKVFHAHPDMNPLNMGEGNILIHYHHNVANVLLSEIVESNWKEIDKNHLGCLAEHEVLMTPDGANVFDDFGKKALFGRSFMFKDAQDPVVIRIVRGNEV